MRFVLSGDETNQNIHGKVFGAMRHLLRTRLEIGSSPTILDATNLRRRDRKIWLRLIAKHGAIAEAVHFDVPLKLALKRNRNRPRVVPEEVVEQMFKGLQPPTEAEGFAKITTISS
jgi:predicted kinase